MPDRIRRGYPIRLPGFNYDGTANNRVGQKPDPTDPTLPIAYLKAQIQALGWNIRYESPLVSASGQLFKVPCVLLSNGEYVLPVSGPIRERMDALPLIYADLEDVPILPGTTDPPGEAPLEILAGHPLQIDDPQYILEPETFLGGRVFVVVFNSSLFIGEYEGDTEIDYTAQVGGADVCSLAGYLAGIETIETTLSVGSNTGAPTSVTPNTEATNAAVAKFKEMVDRYDKFKVVFVKPAPSDIEIFGAPVACSFLNDLLEQVPILFDGDTGVDDTVTDEQFINYFADISEAIVAEMGENAEYRSDGSAPSLSEILDFFEESSSD